MVKSPKYVVTLTLVGNGKRNISENEIPYIEKSKFTYRMYFRYDISILKFEFIHHSTDFPFLRYKNIYELSVVYFRLV